MNQTRDKLPVLVISLLCNIVTTLLQFNSTLVIIDEFFINNYINNFINNYIDVMFHWGDLL